MERLMNVDRCGMSMGRFLPPFADTGRSPTHDSRVELSWLAKEQAALRRVATLVASEAPPEGVFAAVVKEVGWLLGAQDAGMARHDRDGGFAVLATWTAEGEQGAANATDPNARPIERPGPVARILSERRPVRVDEPGIGSFVGSPIVSGGRVWGALFIHSRQGLGPLPPDVEPRLTGFTTLVAAAVANADSRAELMSSRARIAAAADETRRRIGRDLHDGTQQRLVSLELELRAARATVPPHLGELDSALSRVSEGLSGVFDELRHVSHGIHPPILSHGGLEPALMALSRRSGVPVELEMDAARRLPEGVEVAVYYVVSEALTNVVKHAQASVVYVDLDTRHPNLELAIRDDGIGGADPRRGYGLVGLRDRIEALGGTLQVISAAGRGTTLLIDVPLQFPGTRHTHEQGEVNCR
jgi:signal transduction histidine kinase